MKKTSYVDIILTTLLSISCLTACDVSTRNMTIPAENQINITQAAETLGVSVQDFEAFLENIGVTYDNYIETLNENNQSLETVKENIEKNYDCTFKEYIDTVVTVNNKTVPPDDEYTVFKSEYSVFDTYIPIKELDGDTLTPYDITVEIADDAADVAAFDTMQTCNGDFRLYLDIMNETYGCASVELTNIAMFGGHGVKKPTESNPCMDSFFVYDDETDEILDKLTLSMLTMHFDDESKNITLALSNELGLLFKSTGADSEEKMLKLSDLDFQIRKANHN